MRPEKPVTRHVIFIDDNTAWVAWRIVLRDPLYVVLSPELTFKDDWNTRSRPRVMNVIDSVYSVILDHRVLISRKFSKMYIVPVLSYEADSELDLIRKAASLFDMDDD